jgi:single-stranded-DNA-specific exonuclease
MKPPRIERRTAPEAGDWPEAMRPVLRRVYAARGIASPEQIEHRLAALLPPQQLGGIRRACELLETAIREQSRIVIIGDFDCDGATGTAVAVRGLRALGASDVGYAVPNRFLHGYGLSPSIVGELLPQRPRLLITVDNGIAAHAGVAAAKAHGMHVIVTDHHLPGASLPDADAIVNPNAGAVEACAHGNMLCDACAQDASMNAAFPSKHLAGVGVMFYLLLALRARLRESGWFAACGVAEPDLASLLDLVALGTVADLVPLDRNNRILVEAGLKRLRSGRGCAGVAALFHAGKRDVARAVSGDLGFVVGPRINAAGRLEDMQVGIECLLTDDPARAAELAATLSAINAERQELQAGMVEQAEAEVAAWIAARGDEALPHGVVLFNPDWHHGVVGLVASKLKESLQRPVVACAVADGEIKASGRSIPGFHLRDALAEIDARHPGLLLRFGGHAMAAGLSLRRDDIDAFTAAFDAIARERIAPEQLESVLLSDGELMPGDFSIELAQALRAGGPWGQAFPEPLFDGEFKVDSWRVVGEKHLRLKLRRDGGAPVDAVQFNARVDAAPPPRIRAAYQLALDEWQGALRLQLLLRHIEPA